MWSKYLCMFWTYSSKYLWTIMHACSSCHGNVYVLTADQGVVYVYAGGAEFPYNRSLEACPGEIVTPCPALQVRTAIVWQWANTKTFQLIHRHYSLSTTHFVQCVGSQYVSSFPFYSVTPVYSVTHWFQKNDDIWLNFLSKLYLVY